jgi:type VI secretion system secreted protein Hcp
MNTRKPVAGLVLFLLIGIAVLPGMAHAAAYMKLGEIKGEATDDRHRDWIVIQSIQEGISIPISSVIDSKDRTVSRAEFSDIRVGKALDISSPLIRKALASGELINKVEIELLSSNEPDACVYLKYDIDDVLISSVSLSGDSDSLPTEIVTLVFGKIRWIYSRQDKSGVCTKASEAGWDLEADKPL